MGIKGIGGRRIAVSFAAQTEPTVGVRGGDEVVPVCHRNRDSVVAIQVDACGPGRQGIHLPGDGHLGPETPCQFRVLNGKGSGGLTERKKPLGCFVLAKQTNS
eukprot:scaffold1709_cov158-Ochromonas_danica.AAC.2